MTRFAMPEIDDTVASIWSATPNNSVLMMSHYLGPHVFAGLRQFSGALLLEGTLSPQLRELIIIRVGYLSRCEYESFQHKALAELLGVPAAHIDAASNLYIDGLPSLERAILTFVDEVVQMVRPSDASLATLRQHFADSGILEITTIVGFYMMMARTIETMGVPLDERSIADTGSD